MNRTEYLQLLETARRRRLTPTEEARAQDYLATHPDARHEWDEDQSLNRLLGQLDDVPMSSNFTARVLQAVQREPVPAPAEERAAWFENWFSLLRAQRLAIAAIVAAAFLVAIQQYRQRERTRVAESLASLPSIELLKDFDAIARLSQVRGSADEDLLTALQ